VECKESENRVTISLTVTLPKFITHSSWEAAITALAVEMARECSCEVCVHLHTEDGGILIIADDASGEAWPVLCEECCGKSVSA